MIHMPASKPITHLQVYYNLHDVMLRGLIFYSGEKEVGRIGKLYDEIARHTIELKPDEILCGISC